MGAGSGPTPHQGKGGMQDGEDDYMDEEEEEEDEEPHLAYPGAHGGRGQVTI